MGKREQFAEQDNYNKKRVEEFNKLEKKGSVTDQLISLVENTELYQKAAGVGQGTLLRRKTPEEFKVSIQEFTDILTASQQFQFYSMVNKVASGSEGGIQDSIEEFVDTLTTFNQSRFHRIL